MTAREIAKVERAISALRSQLKVLTGCLEGTCSFHAVAWSDYGSELCSGEMIANERKLRSEIKVLEERISMLEGALTGKMDISHRGIQKLREELEGEEWLLRHGCGFVGSERELRERIRMLKETLASVLESQRLINTA